MKIRSLTFAILVCLAGIVLSQCPSYTRSSTQSGTCRESARNIILQGDGSIILTVNGNLTINGDLSILGETLIVNGELTVLGAFNTGQGSSVIIKDGGAVSVMSMSSGFGSTVAVRNGGALAIARNGGSGLYASFEVDFGASVYVGGSFVSGGIGISAIDGDMKVEGDFTNTGGGVVEGNGVLVVGGSYIDNGDHSRYSGVYNGTTFPVEFIDFSGEKEGDQIRLNWETAVELDSHGFEIERSVDGESFSPIGWTPSHTQRLETHKYIFSDNSLESNVNYYRLRKVAFDGKYEYSSIIRIDKEGNFSTLAMSHDPAIGKIRKVNELAEFQLYDPAGNLILEKKNIIRIEAEKLISRQIEKSPVGVYTLSARIGESTDQIRLVKK